MKDMQEKPYHYTECGLDDIWLEGGVEFHESPYGRGVSITDMDGLHRLIGLRLADSLRALRGKEVRFLRIELELSQKMLGALLGVGDTSVARWESGRGRITETSQKLLCLLFREHAFGNTPVAESLKRIASLDAEEYHRMQLVHDHDGWHGQAA